MIVWLAIGGLTLAAVLPLLWPLLRPSRTLSDRLDHDLEVYRDQLREVAAELATNALSEQEAGEVRREIERRILRAAEHKQGSGTQMAPSALTAVLIALLLPALTLFLYTQLGQPSQPGQPLAEREIAPQPQLRDLAKNQNDQIKEMVLRLASRLEAQPDDLDGWILLGRSQAALERYGDAAKALRRALALSGNDANLHVAFGDILIKGANGSVTPEALAAFRKAQELDPGNLGARYFLALGELQANRPQKAYEAWLVLYRELPENSDNRRALAKQIRSVAQELGIDPEGEMKPVATAPSRTAPGPDRAAVAAAAHMSAGDRQQFIQSMVQRLADRLKNEPDDYDGWMRLGKAYGVLQKPVESANAYGRASALRPDDPISLNAQAMAMIEGASPDQKMPEYTLAVLRKLEKLQPDNPRVLWFLGMVDAGNGRRSAAIARWQRLHDQLPENSKERDKLKAAIDRLQTTE
ncbi:MAG: c-type cytochrome biogenesis protein CcmI [Alphaproteobacteria bacterium]|nr:c-type cytochrome biogenesis protein CcmI [Alphaproteobacteria bacterium]